MAENTLGALVTVASDSASRVAYDLALLISQDSRLRPEQRDEKYRLPLYRRCHQATHGQE